MTEKYRPMPVHPASVQLSLSAEERKDCTAALKPVTKKTPSKRQNEIQPSLLSYSAKKIGSPRSLFSAASQPVFINSHQKQKYGLTESGNNLKNVSLNFPDSDDDFEPSNPGNKHQARASSCQRVVSPSASSAAFKSVDAKYGKRDSLADRQMNSLIKQPCSKSLDNNCSWRDQNACGDTFTEPINRSNGSGDRQTASEGTNRGCKQSLKSTMEELVETKRPKSSSQSPVFSAKTAQIQLHDIGSQACSGTSAGLPQYSPPVTVEISDSAGCTGGKKSVVKTLFSTEKAVSDDELDEQSFFQSSNNGRVNVPPNELHVTQPDSSQNSDGAVKRTSRRNKLSLKKNTRMRIISSDSEDELPMEKSDGRKSHGTCFMNSGSVAYCSERSPLGDNTWPSATGKFSQLSNSTADHLHTVEIAQPVHSESAEHYSHMSDDSLSDSELVHGALQIITSPHVSHMCQSSDSIYGDCSRDFHVRLNKLTMQDVPENVRLSSRDRQTLCGHDVRGSSTCSESDSDSFSNVEDVYKNVSADWRPVEITPLACSVRSRSCAENSDEDMFADDDSDHKPNDNPLDNQSGKIGGEISRPCALPVSMPMSSVRKPLPDTDENDEYFSLSDNERDFNTQNTNTEPVLIDRFISTSESSKPSFHHSDVPTVADTVVSGNVSVALMSSENAVVCKEEKRDDWDDDDDDRLLIAFSQQSYSQADKDIIVIGDDDSDDDEIFANLTQSVLETAEGSSYVEANDDENHAGAAKSCEECSVGTESDVCDDVDRLGDDDKDESLWSDEFPEYSIEELNQMTSELAENKTPSVFVDKDGESSSKIETCRNAEPLHASLAERFDGPSCEEISSSGRNHHSADGGSETSTDSETVATTDDWQLKPLVVQLERMSYAFISSQLSKSNEVTMSSDSSLDGYGETMPFDICDGDSDTESDIGLTTDVIAPPSSAGIVMEPREVELNKEVTVSPQPHCTGESSIPAEQPCVMSANATPTGNGDRIVPSNDIHQSPLHCKQASVLLERFQTDNIRKQLVSIVTLANENALKKKLVTDLKDRSNVQAAVSSCKMESAEPIFHAIDANVEGMLSNDKGIHSDDNVLPWGPLEAEDASSTAKSKAKETSADVQSTSTYCTSARNSFKCVDGHTRDEMPFKRPFDEEHSDKFDDFEPIENCLEVREFYGSSLRGPQRKMPKITHQVKAGKPGTLGNKGQLHSNHQVQKQTVNIVDRPAASTIETKISQLLNSDVRKFRKDRPALVAKKFRNPLQNDDLFEMSQVSKAKLQLRERTRQIAKTDTSVAKRTYQSLPKNQIQESACEANKPIEPSCSDGSSEFVKPTALPMKDSYVKPVKQLSAHFKPSSSRPTVPSRQNNTLERPATEPLSAHNGSKNVPTTDAHVNAVVSKSSIKATTSGLEIFPVQPSAQCNGVRSKARATTVSGNDKSNAETGQLADGMDVERLSDPRKSNAFRENMCKLPVEPVKKINQNPVSGCIRKEPARPCKEGNLVTADSAVKATRTLSSLIESNFQNADITSKLADTNLVAMQVQQSAGRQPTLAKIRLDDIKMPSDDKQPAKVAQLPGLSNNTFLESLLAWNPKWLPEYRQKVGESNHRELPPILKDANLYPLLDTYSSYEDYVRIMQPLLTLDAWESIFADWNSTAGRKQFQQVVVVEAVEMLKGSRITLRCQGTSFTRDPNELREGDLIVVNLRPPPGMTIPGIAAGEVKPVFGYILNSQKFGMRQSEKLHPRVVKKLADAKSHGRVLYSIQCVIQLAYRKFPIDNTDFLDVERVSSVVTQLRQFHALVNLTQNKLCPDILRPVNKRVFYHHLYPAEKYNQKSGLNVSQHEAVSWITNAVTQPAACPKICLLHGPPGTGKSHTIVALVENILMKKKPECNKILLCAPSNAGIDELCRRLKSRASSARGGEIQFVRVGQPNSIHPDVMSCSLQEKAKARFRNLQLPESIRDEIKKLDSQIQQLSEQLEQMKTAKNASEVNRISSELAKWTKRRTIVNPKYKEMTFSDEVEMKRQVILKSNVVCTTLNHSGANFLSEVMFPQNSHREKREPFGCIIVDEASQSTEIDCLIPLQYMSTKLVLIGDPEQLPPTVLSQAAAEMNYGQSLFERLYNHFKMANHSPVMMLKTQYRMHPEICSFPNQQVYSGLLQTGQSIAEKRKQFPYEPYYVFDLQDSRELIDQSSNSVCNLNEVEVVKMICKLIGPYMRQKKALCNIGIITPYQKQRKAIVDMLAANDLKDIEVGTVDGFQGREKDIVILSCVRANPTNNIGFLGDRRRLNVSLTRARYALYVVGHLHTLLRASTDWAALVDNARERQRIGEIRSMSCAERVVNAGCQKKAR